MLERIREFLDVRELLTQLVEFLPRFATAVVIIIVAVMFYRISRKVLVKGFEKADFQPALTGLLVENIYRYAIYVIAMIMALDQLGVNVTAALAGVGVLGLAMGFAAQDSVANVISGILIFWDKPFEVGDWIETEGEYGKVTEITLRTTRIRTPRNTYVVVPNKRVIDEVLENYSKHGELRVDAVVGIAYKEDIQEARKVLLAAVKEVEGVLDDPATDVVVDELGGSSVNLKVRVWIAEAERNRATYFRLLEASKLALDEAGIKIPFPHLQLFVDNVEKPVWDKLGELRSAGN
jgi:small conductance mechanosensitive channel